MLKTVRDCLYAVYLVAEALLSFFFTFLGNKIVFIADIEKEFSQIPWKHEHRAFVLFIWYENENETYSENIYQSKICDYRNASIKCPLLLNAPSNRRPPF